MQGWSRGGCTGRGLTHGGFPMGTRAAARARPLPWAFALCPSFVNTCSLFGEILTSKSAASMLQLLLKVAGLLNTKKCIHCLVQLPLFPQTFPRDVFGPADLFYAILVYQQLSNAIKY